MPRTARPTRLRDHWRIRWLDHNGERCSTVFDSYRGADQQRRLKQAEAEEVRRGQRSAPPPEKTVGDALDYWLEKRAPRKRSSGDDQSIIRRHLRPAFGALRLRELGIEHVDQFMAERAALNPKTVNNLLTLLIAGVERGGRSRLAPQGPAHSQTLSPSLQCRLSLSAQHRGSSATAG